MEPKSKDAGVEAVSGASSHLYPWLGGEARDSLLDRFAPPSGFERKPASPSSFAAWLRSLPLLPGRPEVRLFNGEKKGNQQAHEAVVDIDVGDRDLQQCADAVMRLRAEHLRVSGQEDRICFRFTNGSDAVWTAWRDGKRPIMNGNRTAWKKKARPSDSYETFKKYLTKVFQYAGSASLQKELAPVNVGSPVIAGDVFIEGGFPGHAVIVVDVASDAAGRQVFLLLQSYMPAQQMHILKNPGEPHISPWYGYVQGAPLETPEWSFKKGALHRFENRSCDAPKPE